MAGTEITLKRDKPGPWGFRLQGGVDFEKALSVVFVNEGSFSYNSGLRTGDVILKVADLEGALLTHKEAQDEIIGQGNNVRITIKRQNGEPVFSPPGAWKPSVQIVGGPAIVPTSEPQVYTKTSLAVQPQFEEEHFDVKHNVTAKGFQPGAAGSQIRSVAAPVTKPGQAGDSSAVNGFRSVGAPQPNPGGSSAPHQPLVCWVCSQPISGVFLQANGKPLHAECFICTTCKTPLRNVGHFVIGGQLYCQTHAREAQNALQGKTGDSSEPKPGGSGQMPQGLAANLARLSIRPQNQQPRPAGPQPPMTAAVQSQPSNDWNNRLNANNAGMALNAEDFTKEFMKELTGGTGV